MVPQVRVGVEERVKAAMQRSLELEARLEQQAGEFAAQREVRRAASLSSCRRRMRAAQWEACQARMVDDCKARDGCILPQAAEGVRLALEQQLASATAQGEVLEVRLSSETERANGCAGRGAARNTVSACGTQSSHAQPPAAAVAAHWQSRAGRER
jgi:hypothetical protein